MKTSENMAVVSETTATDLSNKEGESAGQTIRTFSGQIIFEVLNFGRIRATATRNISL